MPNQASKKATEEPRAEFYALDNSLLRSKSTGIHLRQKPSILENDLSTPLLNWGTIVRGVPYVPEKELDEELADEAAREAELCMRDIYDRKIPIKKESRDWLLVKGVRNLRGKVDGVTKAWYIPQAINDVPILVEKKGMLTDDEEKAPREAAGPILAEPTDSPPFVAGTGMKYEVVFNSVVVRSSPSMTARPQSREAKGAVVELFDWDETLKWRQVHDRNRRVGWMLLDHPDFGALLRPQCLPFQVRPLEPMVLAVLEQDIHWLRYFIKKGLDVNARDAGERTALMVASEFSRLGAIVVLCATGADASLVNFRGLTALELAGSEKAKALIMALTGSNFSADDCQAALEDLEGDVRELANDFLEKKIARMRFLERDAPAAAGGKAEPAAAEQRPKVVVDTEEERKKAVDMAALAPKERAKLRAEEAMKRRLGN